MPSAWDLLQRFRPVGAPGRSTGVAVPVDRQAELQLELQPVLRDLDDVVLGCNDIRRRAEVQSARWHDRAARRADALLAEAHSEAERSRADLLAAARSEGEARAARLIAAARAAADAVERRGREDADRRAMSVMAAILAVRSPSDGNRAAAP